MILPSRAIGLRQIESLHKTTRARDVRRSQIMLLKDRESPPCASAAPVEAAAANLAI